MSPATSRRRAVRPRSISETLLKLFDLFEPKDRVLINIDADPDSLASAMALKRLLWHKVQSVTIAHFNDIKRFDNVTMVRLLKIPLERLQKINRRDFSKTVLVDGQPHHHEAFGDFNYDAIIDHHPITTAVEAAFVDIRPHYGATATILTEYLRSARIRPSKGLATALLYAIRVDTHNFEAGASEEDVKAFRYLFPYANMNLLRKIEMSDMGVRDLKYFQLALENKRVVKGKIFTHLDHVHSADILVLVADFFMRCHEVAWTVVSGICQKHLVIVIRNDGFRKNAGSAAIKAFGRLGSAGGHRAMARAEISLANLNDYFKKGNSSNLGRFVIRQFQKSQQI
ncbi:MAG: DHH family phosphoesterase [Deltaproteobacteria bacterium]|nr:MAG: DHH family phosphoesterase [Deltaproteobacteria bacterium]